MRGILSLAFISASLVSLAGAAPFPPTPPGTIFCQTFVAPVGPPIVAVSSNSLVNGLELAVTSAKTATLEKVGHRMGWKIDNGGIGAFDYCHYWYLNTGISIGSHLPLHWDFDVQTTTGWIATYGKVIQWQASPTSKPIDTFLACKGKLGIWRVLLQTGTDIPTGETCVETQLLLTVIR